MRDEDEFAEGHIPGSIHLPYGELPDRQGELPRDRPIAAICSGGKRSGLAASILQREGFERRPARRQRRRRHLAAQRARRRNLTYFFFLAFSFPVVIERRNGISRFRNALTFGAAALGSLCA